MIIMCKWLYYWLEQSYYVQIVEDILSRKFNLIVVSFKFLFHCVRILYFNNII